MADETMTSAGGTAGGGGGAAAESGGLLDVATEPSAQAKAEMRMAVKAPSEWLRLLCPDWSLENQSVVAEVDARFVAFKPYLKGLLTSQLLCRLSVSSCEARGGHNAGAGHALPLDFWKILGVEDEFDRAHIVASVERFCVLYGIRGGDAPATDRLAPSPQPSVGTMAGRGGSPVALYDPATTAAVAVAAAGMGFGAAAADSALLLGVDPASAAAAATLAHASQAEATQADLGLVPAPPAKVPHIAGRPRRPRVDPREREAEALRRAAERAARHAAREEERKRKLDLRRLREESARAQKEAALRRAAELVQSNRIPIELTRGAAAAAQVVVEAGAAGGASAAMDAPAAATSSGADGMGIAPPDVAPPAPAAAPSPSSFPIKKCRSSIVISTASDLDQIVTHSNNLWAKYNAIAREHNQRVNWIVVAKELGIHVKVREKYARMHARARARGFDFVRWGHYRIRDYPQYFLDPLVENALAPLGMDQALVPVPAPVGLMDVAAAPAPVPAPVYDPAAPAPAHVYDPAMPTKIEELPGKESSAEGGTGEMVADPPFLQLQQPQDSQHLLGGEAPAALPGDNFPAVVEPAPPLHEHHHPSEVSGDEGGNCSASGSTPV